MSTINSVNANETGIQSYNNQTGDWTGTPITQYAALVGGAANIIQSVSPTSTTGIPLVSQGSSVTPGFNTASVSGGGTGVTSVTPYAVICGGTASTAPLQDVSGVGTSGQVLTSNGAGALPTWQNSSSSAVQTITGNTGGAESPTAGNFNIVGTGSITVSGSTSTETIQLTGLTAHNVLLGEGTATVGLAAPSSVSGIPLVSNGSSSDPSFTTAVVAGGGTGSTAFTAYAPVCGGTTGTGNLQSASSGISNSGYILTSTGSASLPTWQAVTASGAVTTIDADSGSATPSSGVITVSGGTTGLTTSASGSTVDVTGTLNVGHGGTGDASFTAYSVICGGTTSTGNLQNVSGLGTSGQVLTSNGASALPTWQTSSAGIQTITGNTGGPESPSAGNFNIVGTGSITVAGSTNTETIQLTGLTNHAVLVGAGTATITNVGPTSTAGQVLQSSGSSADPAFSTATYPSTTTANQILYSSATNTVSGLATANNAALLTSSSGVPSFYTNAIMQSATPFLTAFGSGAANSSTGVDNTAFGYQTLNSNTSGTDSTAVGYQALKVNTGSENTGVGSGALASNTSGSNLTAIGYQALNAANTISNCTALGSQALLSAVSPATYLTAVGYQALKSATGVNDCTAMGAFALNLNQANNNSAFGAFAMQNASSGGNGVGVGYFALNAQTTGASNTACGFESLYQLTTGADNCGFGYKAGSAYTSSETNNLCLGYNVNGTAGESNIIRVGNSSHTNCYLSTPLATTPPSSHTATTAFGTSLTAGTSVQNTLGYDIHLNICVQVSSSITATLTLGVGSTSTPTVDTVIPSFTVSSTTFFTFSALVPNNYYVLVNTTGTITITSITTQACPL